MELFMRALGTATSSALLTGEKKLSKVIVPDNWKEGASNTTEGGDRKINENKLLSKKSRTGIAYISNVAVHEKYRRKGIAKRLIAKAEAQARGWGCRAIALHCDLNNSGATKLYKGQGFRCIKVPEGVNWPQPKTSPDIKFNFMMKLLQSPASAYRHS